MSVLTYTKDDELLARCVADRLPRLGLWVPDQEMVVVGRHGNPELEVNLEVCEQQQVQVFRRRAGGGSVVLGPGQVVVSLFLPVRDRGRLDRHLDRISNWLADGIQAATTLRPEIAGFSDLAIDNKKISGSGMLWTHNVLYYTASILVDFPLQRLEALLPYPPKEPQYRLGRSHADFVANLSTWVPGLTASTLHQGLRRHLSVEGL